MGAGKRRTAGALVAALMLASTCGPARTGTTVDGLMSRMSLPDKLGQMVQVERAAVTPDQVKHYRLGSVLAGDAPAGWDDSYAAYQDAALATPRKIPLLSGAGAAPGSTIFPNDLGLAATGDPDLVRRVGTATAEEVTGAGAVTVSLSRRNEVPSHAEEFPATGVLKTELGFTGFVVSDRAGVDRIDGRPGFTRAEIVTAVNAGLDMVTVPHDWPVFLTELRAAVDTGEIPMSRIDDANRRILRGKLALGLFDHPYADRSPTRPAGRAEHRELARQAVRESQVLLRNDGVLPLAKNGGKLFVAGRNADDLGHQAGGRTAPGPGSNGADGTTVLRGIRDVAGSGTTVTYDRAGEGVDGTYRAAVAVLGETPGARPEADRPGGPGLDDEDRAVLAKLRAAGVPVIVVLVSGQPMDVASLESGWAAFVAAWLPGSAGAGVADVLFGDYAPTGRLPVPWPASTTREPVHVGDAEATLHAYGYGLTFDADATDAAPPSSPGTPAATTLELRWTPATDTGGSGLDGYDVLRDNGLIGTTTAVTFPIGRLSPGVHQFTVVARDKAGNRSAPSTPLVVTVPDTGGCKTRDSTCAVT
ncbi:hypothetical protein GCM10010172_75340 [Paractinoplanes ferrugineus]|uniref:beta-glucosidase n=1 Tax=Paractinoplanes ferrugineus TaxID=113564 RepID=A0A919M9A3_9ACTN|nr:glycoside hydrolase family 3 C-terminal domain-containing protein [Actinoplanes ferrugineus]GIE11311.1 hypothetical protein Afe05nite_31510 [Actinoplanes ferrugineus]